MNEANMGFNKFCGPAALSILTGRNTDECADAIRYINGQYRIKGVTMHDLIAAGDRLGLLFEPQQVFENRSLFFTATILAKKDGRFLVLIPNHFIVLEVKDGSIELCDNHTKTPIDLQNSARLHQKVQKVYVVKEKPPAPIVTVLEYKFEVEKRIGEKIEVKKICKMSDGGIKIYSCGSIAITSDKDLQEIAFAIMELTNPSLPPLPPAA